MKLGILSWNIGSIDDKKIPNLINEFFKKCGEHPHLIVIGFQELKISDTFFGKLKKELTKYMNPKDYSLFGEPIYTCRNIVSITEGFGIGTFVFIKSGQKKKITQFENTESCPIKTNGTKGYIIISLTIYGESFYFVNTHMPFKNLEKSIESATDIVNALKRITKSDNLSEKNIVIFGDLNARSLLTKKCYDKEMESCLGNSDPYCNIINFLEGNMLNGETFVGGSINTNTNYCSEYDDEYKDFFYYNAESLNKYEVVKEILKKTDSLKLVKPFKLFQEGEITFLPTYKRDEKDMKFKLTEKNRLPGYADRIIFTGENMTANNPNYTSLEVAGNDHLPIMAVFEISMNETGGGKFSKKNKKRKRSVKRKKILKRKSKRFSKKK